MAWIEIHQELPEHPKTDALMDVIGCERPAAVGHVIMSLLWALRYAHDGVIVPKRLGAIARGAGWVADPDGFASAMVEAGWWDVLGDGWKLHDWDVYAGMLLAKREKDAARKRGDRGADNPKLVQRTSDGRPSDARMDGAGTNSTNQHDQPVHVSTHVDVSAKVAPLTGELPDLDDVLEVVTPEAKAEGVTKADAPRRRGYPEEFEAFWVAYPGPRKVDKVSCRAKFNKILSGGVLVADLLAGLDAWKRSDDWSKDGGQFICAPLVWLNRRRWEDSPAGPGGAAPGAALPIPSEIRDRPWVAVWVEKRGTQPEPLTVMNLASALGVDPYAAVRLYRDEGLAAAGDWVWDSRETG